jgi:hypothetical protein
VYIEKARIVINSPILYVVMLWSRDALINIAGSALSIKYVIEKNFIALRLTFAVPDGWKNK